MVEIPDSLRSVFSATVHERDGTYIVEIPANEVTHDAVTTEETYRVALLDAPTSPESTEGDAPSSLRSQRERIKSNPQDRRLTKERFVR